MEGAEITKNSMLIYILVDPLEPYTQQTATMESQTCTQQDLQLYIPQT